MVIITICSGEPSRGRALPDPAHKMRTTPLPETRAPRRVAERAVIYPDGDIPQAHKTRIMSHSQNGHHVEVCPLTL